ncbi:MAG: hypothetical protein COA58_05385 [Bacteroidetes bacterium]|nr:MAG: hypothetical protein COA58_05385 [Bacteroidota bacterium]
MKNLFLITLITCTTISAMGQLSTVSNDKPMGYVNPALQNYDLEKGVVSVSYVINPLVKDTIPAGILAIAEFKINEKLRVGVSAFQVENRLSKSQTAKAYLSYKLELEPGNYIIVGANIGAYTDEVRVTEFNKVFAPNKFSYGPDSSATGKESGIDLGVGIAYSYNGFQVGLGFGKVNRPAAYPFPISEIEKAYNPSDPKDSFFVHKDTSVMLESGNFGIEINFNAIYEWNLNENIKILHSLHVGNLDLAGVDYLGLQNIVKINNRHSIGLGAFYNGTPGFIGSLGYGISEDFKVEVATFFTQDLNFDPTVGKYGDYVNDGYQPSFEFNLRYEF